MSPWIPVFNDSISPRTCVTAEEDAVVTRLKLWFNRFHVLLVLRLLALERVDINLQLELMLIHLDRPDRHDLRHAVDLRVDRVQVSNVLSRSIGLLQDLSE